MTREEAIKHGEEQLEIFGGTHREFIETAIKALEQEPTTKNDLPKYCDRNICLKNEYNNIGCEDCEVTKSQEPTTKNDLAVDCVSRQDVLSEIIRFSTEEGASVACQQLYCDVNNMPSVTQLSSELEKNSKKLEKDFGESDCISRVDAIKAMQDKAKKLKNEDTINGLCGAVAILFDMPSVTPQEPRWIPVSERLPDIHNYSEKYLVTLSNGEVTEVMFIETNGKSWWEWTRYKIVAWIPLPQPYEPQESEDT